MKSMFCVWESLNKIRSCCNLAMLCCNLAMSCCNLAMSCCNLAMSCCNLAMLCYNQDFQQSDGDSHQESVLYNAQYRDLVRLVNCQREKLSAQQAELTKVWLDLLILCYVAVPISHFVDWLIYRSGLPEPLYYTCVHTTASFGYLFLSIHSSVFKQFSL